MYRTPLIIRWLFRLVGEGPTSNTVMELPTTKCTKDTKWNLINCLTGLLDVLIINFNVEILKAGIKRSVLQLLVFWFSSKKVRNFMAQLIYKYFGFNALRQQHVWV